MRAATVRSSEKIVEIAGLTNRLFTADAGIIVYRAGHVSESKLNEVVAAQKSRRL
jgi:hypothetical protein